MQIPLDNNKGAQILARSLFKDLRGNGYSAHQVLSLTTELIDLVTQGLRETLAARQSELEIHTPAQPQVDAAWRSFDGSCGSGRKNGTIATGCAESADTRAGPLTENQRHCAVAGSAEG